MSPIRPPDAQILSALTGTSQLTHEERAAIMDGGGEGIRKPLAKPGRPAAICQDHVAGPLFCIALPSNRICTRTGSHPSTRYLKEYLPYLSTILRSPTSFSPYLHSSAEHAIHQPVACAATPILRRTLLPIPLHSHTRATRCDDVSEQIALGDCGPYCGCPGGTIRKTLILAHR